MLTIYGRKSSFNVQKVMWLVGEPIEHNHIELAMPCHLLMHRDMQPPPACGPSLISWDRRSSRFARFCQGKPPPATRMILSPVLQPNA